MAALNRTATSYTTTWGTTCASRRQPSEAKVHDQLRLRCDVIVPIRPHVDHLPAVRQPRQLLPREGQGRRQPVTHVQGLRLLHLVRAQQQPHHCLCQRPQPHRLRRLLVPRRGHHPGRRAHLGVPDCPTLGGGKGEGVRGAGGLPFLSSIQKRAGL